MLKQDILLLQTTDTDDSGWTDVSMFEDWSLFISALESGATITVYAQNNSSTNQQLPDSTSGTALVLTLTGGAGPYLISNQSIKDNASTPGIVVPHYILVKKTQGGSPAETNVYMFGRSFARGL